MPERIVFMDCSLSSMICAHKLLDSQEDLEIHLVTEAFEVGMYGESPGLITTSSWPMLRPHWISDSGFDHPTNASHTAIKSSWLRKAVAISLSGRGAKFHTGTRRTSISTNDSSIQLSYPGSRSRVLIEFDHIVHSEKESGTSWNGAIVTRPPDWPCSMGLRPDGSFEIWWKGNDSPNSPLQVMEWIGIDPDLELSRQSSLSESKLANIDLASKTT